MQPTTVRASAPGKLLLCGEYAVLDGAPAICMAVDRRARVEVASRDGDEHVVSSRGFSDVIGRCKDRDGGLEWLAGADEYKLVDDVWVTALAKAQSSLSIVLDSSEFVYAGGRSKIGIGSSAALVVALSAALSELAEAVADVGSIAFAAHRRFQNGLGSGVDVACSLHGGLIEYSLGARDSRRLEWPAGLAHALLWSGVASSTERKLSQLRRQDSQPSRAALVDAAKSLARIWVSASVAEILAGFRSFTRALHEFSIDHQLGIFDAGHEELVAAAAAAGLVYKPCGAGGGDVGILLGDDEATIAAFIGSELPAEFQQLQMQIDCQGVHVEREWN